MPIVPGRVTGDRLAQFLEAARRSGYSYPTVGATRSPAFPGGYEVVRASVYLGVGEAVFERAAMALDQWNAHRGAGATVVPDRAPEEGETVVVALPMPGVTIVAPCRVVYVTDEPDRSGFAYGTLSGHPERGEEAFHITRTGDRVSFEIVAFSRPAHPLARLGAPVARRLQATVTDRYLAALKAYVANK